MESRPDFSALRAALRHLSNPMEPEVNRFLIEFHRRQRAQLLVPQSPWARLAGWVREHTESLSPSLSYASGFAAIALAAFLTFSGQVRVAPADGSYKLSLNLPGKAATVAMLPTSLVRDAASSSKAENLTFTRPAARATHFILANTRVAYDATPAF